MQVLFVSECQGMALEETRRILDQFAERKGTRTWQTSITMAGVTMVRRMLGKSARKNTAVACHWIKSGGRTEVLWIVGRLRAYGRDGIVPTNSTGLPIVERYKDNLWQAGESILLIAILAAVFHDFGKATDGFQKKLRASAASRQQRDRYRHEWLSLALFYEFVGGRADREWLEELAAGVTSERERALIDAYESRVNSDSFADWRPFYRKDFPTSLTHVIAWLIVGHHRLPVSPNECKLNELKHWLPNVTSTWNQPLLFADQRGSSAKDFALLNNGTPFRSQAWRSYTQGIARRALVHEELLKTDWREKLAVRHLARLCLMLADHVFSAQSAAIDQAARRRWQDPKLLLYANTDRRTKALRQRLDEHLIGVSKHVRLVATALPRLSEQLPALEDHKILRRRTTDSRFLWQNAAYDLADALAQSTMEHGFFGVNMASTGAGKTLANARIMYGLAGERRRCRFTIALGLRTLTLQTGDALRDRLRLSQDDLAVVIGSRAVVELHELNKARSQEQTTENQDGSLWGESGSPLLPEHLYVRYEGLYGLHSLFGRNSYGTRDKHSSVGKIDKLLSAPVLVTTLDQLIDATEGTRGGAQIAPMLRLLTADLVLDEPDEFDVSDMPALCRFVNWCGLLGTRVLLSSATLSPALLRHLFDAYRAGRAHYAVIKGQGGPAGIVCGWFDETVRPRTALCGTTLEFVAAHRDFVAKRVPQLKAQPPIRRGRIVLLDPRSGQGEARTVYDSVAQTVAVELHKLHDVHCEIDPQTGKRVSFGIVRFANIDPLVQVAKHIVQTNPPDGRAIYFCIYHSRFPLVVRSHIESQLDVTLCRKRDKPKSGLNAPLTGKILRKSLAKDVLFVVFASPVAEVGRDHDYDWAVVEPSSMRSLVQLAGRIRRHRGPGVDAPNIVILERNIKALKAASDDVVVFSRPGFERAEYRLKSHSMVDLLTTEQCEVIDASSRIEPPDPTTVPWNQSLAGLEEHVIDAELKKKAAIWWQQEDNPAWCGVMQQKQPFRSSAPMTEYVLRKDDEDEAAYFCERLPSGELSASVDRLRFERRTTNSAPGVVPWFECSFDDLLNELALELDEPVAVTSERFGSIMLDREEHERWIYDEVFGVYRARDGTE